MKSPTDSGNYPAVWRWFIGGPGPGAFRATTRQHAGSRPVVMVAQRRVKTGCRLEFQQALETYVASAVSFHGHLDVHFLCRVRGCHEDFVLAHRFINADARSAFTSALPFSTWLSCLRQLTDEIPEAADTRAGDDSEGPAAPTRPFRLWPAVVAIVTCAGLMLLLALDIPSASNLLPKEWRLITREAASALLLAGMVGWLIVCARHLRPITGVLPKRDKELA